MITIIMPIILPGILQVKKTRMNTNHTSSDDTFLHYFARQRSIELPQNVRE